MKLLHKKTTHGYCSVILLLTLVFTLSACKKKQPPTAQDETQKDLVKSTPQPQAKAQDEMAEDKIPLRILYVGLSNTERQKDFVSFLSQNFIEVKTADLYAFKEEQTEGSDVIILDKDGIQWGNEGGGKPLRDLRVSAQYSRPTISLGIPGAFWTDRMRLKTGYM